MAASGNSNNNPPGFQASGSDPWYKKVDNLVAQRVANKWVRRGLYGAAGVLAAGPFVWPAIQAGTGWGLYKARHHLLTGTSAVASNVFSTKLITKPLKWTAAAAALYVFANTATDWGNGRDNFLDSALHNSGQTAERMRPGVGKVGEVGSDLIGGAAGVVADTASSVYNAVSSDPKGSVDQAKRALSETAESGEGIIVRAAKAFGGWQWDMEKKFTRGYYSTLWGLTGGLVFGGPSNSETQKSKADFKSAAGLGPGEEIVTNKKPAKPAAKPKATAESYIDHISNPQGIYVATCTKAYDYKAPESFSLKDGTQIAVTKEEWTKIASDYWDIMYQKTNLEKINPDTPLGQAVASGKHVMLVYPRIEQYAAAWFELGEKLGRNATREDMRNLVLSIDPNGIGEDLNIGVRTFGHRADISCPVYSGVRWVNDKYASIPTKSLDLFVKHDRFYQSTTTHTPGPQKMLTYKEAKERFYIHRDPNGPK